MPKLLWEVQFVFRDRLFRLHEILRQNDSDIQRF